MSEKQTKCVNIGQGIVFSLLLDFKTIAQHFVIMLFAWNIIWTAKNDVGCSEPWQVLPEHRSVAVGA